MHDTNPRKLTEEEETGTPYLDHSRARTEEGFDIIGGSAVEGKVDTWKRSRFEATMMTENLLSLWRDIIGGTVTHPHRNLARPFCHVASVGNRYDSRSKDNPQIPRYTPRDYSIYYFYEDAVPSVQLMRKNPFSNWREADQLALIKGICAAASHLHQHGIVHGDISPSNLLIQEYPDPAGSAERPPIRAILTDYELARQLGKCITLPGFGALPYMPPEHNDHRTIAAATGDIYSIAATLAVILEWEDIIVAADPDRPHDSSDPDIQYLYNPTIIDYPRDNPPEYHLSEALYQSLEADYGTQVAEVLKRATAHNPAKRQQSVRELLAELTAAFAMRPQYPRRARPTEKNVSPLWS